MFVLSIPTTYVLLRKNIFFKQTLLSNKVKLLIERPIEDEFVTTESNYCVKFASSFI